MNSIRDRIHSVTSQLGESSDFVTFTLELGQQQAEFLYIKSLINEPTLERKYVVPFVKAASCEEYIQQCLSAAGVEVLTNDQDAVSPLLSGKVLLVLQDQLYLLDVPLIKNENVPESSIETSVQGPQFALSESLPVNLNLIRTRYPQPSLKVSQSKVGRISQTPMAMIYDQDFVDPNVLQKVLDAIAKLNVDMIQSPAELNRELTGKKYELFPTLMITDRPDRIAHNLSNGKIVLILNGTPFALILPAVFYDFMSAMDDLYSHFWPGRMMLTLRYIGLFVSLTLSAFYVAITSYNPEILRVQLTLSIAGSRAPVPYPSYIEVLFMLFMMEMLLEASVRLPKSIGSTATTVGGLILGQAATQAGLISNIMIIIVASVAISNFVVPVIAMSFGIRFTKYIFLLMATLFGIIGIMSMYILLIAYLTNMQSFGQSYLRLFENPKNMSKKKEGPQLQQ